jgi:hypothetical protein
MLHAYLDESGIHTTSPICVVAGYFGGSGHWARFDLKWRRILDAHKIEAFHANRYWSHVNGSNVSEYRNWDDEKCGRFIRALLDALGSQRLYPIGCAVDTAEWKALSQDERSFLTGGSYDETGRMTTNGAPNKPYYLPFLTVIADSLDCCKPGISIDFTFASNRQLSGYAANYFQEIKKIRRDNFMKMGHIEFADAKSCPAIQAGDLLAYELYQHGVRRLQAGGAQTSPTPALVLATRNAQSEKVLPFCGSIFFESMLARFRAAQLSSHA